MRWWFIVVNVMYGLSNFRNIRLFFNRDLDRYLYSVYIFVFIRIEYNLFWCISEFKYIGILLYKEMK